MMVECALAGGQGGCNVCEDSVLMQRQWIESLNRYGRGIGDISSYDTNSPKMEDVVERMDVGDDCVDEIVLVSLLFKECFDGVRSVPTFRCENRRLREVSWWMA